MVDQRPYHDHTRFVIDAQQALGLWQRDAESWHFGVLSLDPASQISKRWGLSVGFRYWARHLERTSRFCIHRSRQEGLHVRIYRVARSTCNIAHLRSALKPSRSRPRMAAFQSESPGSM